MLCHQIYSRHIFSKPVKINKFVGEWVVSQRAVTWIAELRGFVCMKTFITSVHFSACKLQNPGRMGFVSTGLCFNTLWSSLLVTWTCMCLPGIVFWLPYSLTFFYRPSQGLCNFILFFGFMNNKVIPPPEMENRSCIQKRIILPCVNYHGR